MTSKQKHQVIDILKQTFELIEHKTPDIDPYKIGYSDEKLILNLGKQFADPVYEPIRHKPFEVQLRFIFMDAWAKFSHKFVYKDEASIPQVLLRKIQIMGAASEMLDGLADLRMI